MRVCDDEVLLDTNVAGTNEAHATVTCNRRGNVTTVPADAARCTHKKGPSENFTVLCQSFNISYFLFRNAPFLH